MFTRVFYTLCFLFLSVVVFGQVQTKQVAKQTTPDLKKLLSNTNLPYRIVSDSVAIIPYGGANITSYNVIVQKVADLYIIYSNLSEALPGKINEEKYKYLLNQNDHFDIIKIGINADDNTVYVRADIYKQGTTSSLLNRIIKQVANVTNIIGGDLK